MSRKSKFAKHIAFRLPSEYLDRFRQLAAEEGSGQSELFRAALDRTYAEKIGSVSGYSVSQETST
jgi:predicted DNA-binding protein